MISTLYKNNLPIPVVSIPSIKSRQEKFYGHFEPLNDRTLSGRQEVRKNDY